MFVGDLATDKHKQIRKQANSFSSSLPIFAALRFPIHAFRMPLPTPPHIATLSTPPPQVVAAAPARPHNIVAAARSSLASRPPRPSVPARPRFAIAARSSSAAVACPSPPRLPDHALRLPPPRAPLSQASPFENQ
jgi:hypothetical protein